MLLIRKKATIDACVCVWVDDGGEKRKKADKRGEEAMNEGRGIFCQVWKWWPHDDGLGGPSVQPFVFVKPFSTAQYFTLFLFLPAIAKPAAKHNKER